MEKFSHYKLVPQHNQEQSKIDEKQSTLINFDLVTDMLEMAGDMLSFGHQQEIDSHGNNGQCDNTEDPACTVEGKLLPRRQPKIIPYNLSGIGCLVKFYAFRICPKELNFSFRRYLFIVI